MPALKQLVQLIGGPLDGADQLVILPLPAKICVPHIVKKCRVLSDQDFQDAVDRANGIETSQPYVYLEYVQDRVSPDIYHFRED